MTPVTTQPLQEATTPVVPAQNLDKIPLTELKGSENRPVGQFGGGHNPGGQFQGSSGPFQSNRQAPVGGQTPLVGSLQGLSQFQHGGQFQPPAKQFGPADYNFAWREGGGVPPRH